MVFRSVRPATLTIGMSRGKPNGRPFPTSPWRAWPLMSSPCLKCILEKKFSIVWSCVWSDTVATVWPSGRAKRSKEVAVMMIRHWLTVFGVPYTICSNCRPQFTGGWFKAMCSLMGIRHAKSVAYLSRSNGRAEVAGGQLFEKLRKIRLTNKRGKWFEEMWRALKANHDTPTLCGLSPHQILFGRDPLARGSPCQVMAWQ